MLVKMLRVQTILCLIKQNERSTLMSNRMTLSSVDAIRMFPIKVRLVTGIASGFQDLIGARFVASATAPLPLPPRFGFIDGDYARTKPRFNFQIFEGRKRRVLLPVRKESRVFAWFAPRRVERQYAATSPLAASDERSTHSSSASSVFPLPSVFSNFGQRN